MLFCPTNREVRALLDPLDNSSCNAHLAGMILDASIGAIVPSLVMTDATSNTDADHSDGQEDLEIAEEIIDLSDPILASLDSG